jgi:cytidylate kinase
MQEQQRHLAATRSVVMEGRDIGTVVFPDARVKVFLDADPDERARRRAVETGLGAEGVARELAERDHRDRSRPDAPLTQAPDAEYLDTTGLSLDLVEEAVLKLVRKRVSN